MGICHSTSSGVPLDSDIPVEALRRDGSTRVLAEAKAWEIALAWTVPLQGHAWLITDEARVSTSIVPTFEWVLFHFCGRVAADYTLKARERFAANARAATIAWFALSCCEGYSGTENPQFWRRVFLEYRYPPSSNQQFQADKLKHGRDLLLSESVRFFTTPGQPFPRVSMIAAPGEDEVSVESIFLGRHLHVDKTRDAKLHHTLTTLKPFIRQRQWARSIPVKIDHVPIAKVVDLLQMDTSPPIRGPISSELHPQSTLPQLRLAAMGIEESDDFTSHRVLARLPYSEIDFLCSQAMYFVVCRSWSRAGASSQSQLETQHYQTWWRIPRLHMYLPRLKRDFGVVCSAVPHLRSIESLDVCLNSMQTQSARDWLWLGYALFHPDAESQSGLTGLSINIHSTSSNVLSAMYYMSQGNNLLAAARTDEGGASVVYVEGRVGATVNIWPQPIEERPLQSCLRKDSWITMCVGSIAAFEEEESEWACVVNPGFGFGWLRRSSVIELRSRPPGRPTIRTLRIHGFKSEHESNMAMLLDFFKKSLNAVSFVGGDAMPSSTVLKILQLCASLKTLCVCHDGSSWASEDADPLGCLEELQLTFKGSSAELKQLNARCLPHLKALRVVTMKPEIFSGHQNVLMTFLREQEVVEKQHGAARRFLQVLRDKEIHVAHQPLHHRCLVAFLSVIARVAASNTRSKRSPLGFFGQDIVVLISQYSTSSVRREVTIE